MELRDVEELGAMGHNFALALVSLRQATLSADGVGWPIVWSRESTLVQAFAVGLFVVLTRTMEEFDSGSVIIERSDNTVDLAIRNANPALIRPLTQRLDLLVESVSEELGVTTVSFGARFLAWADAAYQPYEPGSVRQVGPHSYEIDHRKKPT